MNAGRLTLALLVIALVVVAAVERALEPLGILVIIIGMSALIPFAVGVIAQLLLRARGLPAWTGWTLALVPVVLDWALGGDNGFHVGRVPLLGAVMTLVWNWGFIVAGTALVQGWREATQSHRASESLGQQSGSPEA